METGSLKADLHVHSRFSSRPSQWILQKLGCPESFTEPEDLYRTARSRGMDLVTITDHNTLAGSLAIAHLPGTFVSEEITTYFPEDRCKLHVLALGITETQHAEITKLRENVFELASYLRDEEIVSILAHPLYAVNERLTLDHFEKTLLLFRNFELNGARDDSLNQILTRILLSLTQEDIDLLVAKHGIEPLYEQAWLKNITAGSDDHSSLNIARAYTEVENAGDPATYLSGLVQGRCKARVRPSMPQTMAHNLYGIAYQFYKNRFGLEKYIHSDGLLKFVDQTLTTNHDANGKGGFFVRLSHVIPACRSRFFSRSTNCSVQEMLLNEGRKLVGSLSDKPASHAQCWDAEDSWYSLVNQTGEKVLKHLADTILANLSQASFFDIFHTAGSAGSLYAILAPYFVSYNQFTKDRQFSKQCLARFCKGDFKDRERINMAHFMDVFKDWEKVSETMHLHLETAAKNGKQYSLITCGTDPGIHGVHTFPSIGTFCMDEAKGISLAYPPFLPMLQYCFQERFTHLHAATPGPLGLAALGIARILNLPIHGTHDATLPRHVGELTGDTGLENMIWSFLVWFYNQLDRVYVSSWTAGEELVARGVKQSRIKVCPKGIDLAMFNPGKRNGFFQKYRAVEPFKLLYVGRICREENTPFLTEVFARLAQSRQDLRLVVVGDGPYLERMQSELDGLPVTFTGVLPAEELAEAFASSDIFVSPASTDASGETILEALASGLPAVVTDQGELQENVIPGQTGMILPAHDVDSFSRAVLEMIDDPLRLSRMKKQARQSMSERSFEAAFLSAWESIRQPCPTHLQGATFS